jgi:deoxyuridine 5'-triphosphate nucleotidohydrolase
MPSLLGVTAMVKSVLSQVVKSNLKMRNTLSQISKVSLATKQVQRYQVSKLRSRRFRRNNEVGLPFIDIFELAAIATNAFVGRRNKARGKNTLSTLKVLIEPHQNKDVPLPRQAHPGEDAAYDLYYAGKRTIVWPFQTKKLITNCKVSIPQGIMGDIRPRSGLLSKGVRVAGTLDSGYRDFVYAIVYNGSLVPRLFHTGDRIAQIAFIQVHSNIEWEVVEKLPTDSRRGANGFGSTGRR